MIFSMFPELCAANPDSRILVLTGVRNYHRQVMDVAAAVLRAGGSRVEAPTSARVGRHEPEVTPVPSLAPLGEIVRSEWRRAGEGTVINASLAVRSAISWCKRPCQPRSYPGARSL